MADFLGNPLLNIGAGLLSVAGPSQQPRSIGEGLLIGLQNARQAQAASLQNQFFRNKLSRQAQRDKAIAQLGGLLMPGSGQIGPTNDAAQRVAAGIDPSVAMGGGGAGLTKGPTGEVTPQALGLLAQIAPEQLAASIFQQQFGQERAEPSMIRALRAAGIDPASDEGRQIIKQRFAREGGTLEQLDTLLKGLTIQKLQEEIKAQGEEKATTERAANQAVLQSIDGLAEMAKINDELDGTALETGVSLPDLRRAALSGKNFLMEQFGFEPEGAEDLAAKVDRFEKLATQEVLRAAKKAHLGGAFTNQQLQTFQASKPGTSVRPEANRLVIADMLETSLLAADARGIDVRNLKEKQALVRRLRGEEEAEAAKPARKPAREKKSRIIDFFSLPEN
ncbi:MAG: hypothetical protein RIB80_04595 [Rhodospirillales bacterium]